MAIGWLELPVYILLISILVTVHEFGHFWVARRLGFKVLRFSIGFGKPLWMRVGADGTEYAISRIPLGGYVRLADERDAPVADEDLPRAFTRRPIWQRVAVLVAGAGANFLFAWLAYSALYVNGVPTIRAVIADVHAGSLAAQAGLQAGDEVVAVGGRTVRGIDEAMMESVSSVLSDGAIRFELGGPAGRRSVVVRVPPERRRALTEPGALEPSLGLTFVQPRLRAVIGAMNENSTAKAAGVQVGDEVLAVDNQPVADYSALRRLISPRPGDVVTLRLRRAGTDLERPVAIASDTDPSIPGGRVGRIGVLPAGPGEWPAGVQVTERYGPFGALSAGGRLLVRTTAVTVRVVAHMVAGQASSKNISGPVGIARVAAFSLLAGWQPFLSLLAGISIGLGILNLLPLPLLDGGQVVLQLFEALKGGPLSDRAMGIIQRVGFAILILLTVLAVYNDLSRPG